MYQYKKLVLFLVSALGLYITWYMIYELYIHPDGRLDNWLNQFSAQCGAIALSLFGFKAEATTLATIAVSQKKIIRIGDSCNGLEFFALFAGFVALFPGQWKRKVVFIPIGILLIFLLNIIRILVLVLNYYYSRYTFAFNHKYTYSFIIYAIIFGMWMLWVNKFSSLPKKYHQVTADDKKDL